MPPIRKLHWEQHAIEHLALSEITPDDVEELIFGTADEEPKTRILRHGNFHVVYGQTGDGCLIQVAGEFIGEGTFRPFGGRQMNENEKRAFRRMG